MTNFDDYIIHHLKDLHEIRSHQLDGILASPRNISNGPAQPQLWQDFRFKGFPDKSFHAPKVPKYKRMSVDLMNSERDDQYFGKTTRFDTVRNQDPKPGNGQTLLDDRKEPQYTVRDPLGNLTDRRYVIRDPYGDLTEEHKFRLQKEMRDIEEDKKQRDIIDKLRTEERLEERRKDKEMLTNYYPWGKPGGGAPTEDTRKQKFLETDLTGSPTPSYRERMERDRQAVEERFRYNQDRAEQERYSQELARQRNEHELRKQEDRLDNLQRELETLKTDNYGKPGGGAPNRTASESFTERRQPMQSMESPRRAPPSNRYDSYNDVGRSLPYADRLARINREVLPLYHPFGRAGGGAPNKDPKGHVVTQIQGNLNMENYKFQDSTIDQKTRDRARAKEYYDFLKGQEQEQRRNKQEIEYHMKAPIGELATIMGSKNVGKPVKDPYTGEIKNHHLGNSDVTLQKMNYQPKAISEKKKYHEDLSQLADERMRYRQLNRLKDNQEGMLHHNTMDAMWGRPGGGAPKGYNLRKFNLESTLHHPSKDQSTEEYIKKKDWSQVAPEFFRTEDPYWKYLRDKLRKSQGGPFATSNDTYSPRFQPNKYVRSTVPSNHANLYEYPEQHKDKHYALTEPYATF